MEEESPCFGRKGGADREIITLEIINDN